MNLVGGYGSDSDDDGAPAAQPQHKLPTQRDASGASSQSTGGQNVQQQRRVKRLDISILPPEIQAALARGDSSRDSDDEEVTSIVRKAATSKDAGVTSQQCPLLGILPAPKSKEELLSQPPPVAESGTKVSNTSAAPAPSASSSKFVFGFSNTETKRVPVSTGAVKDAKTNNASDQNNPVGVDAAQDEVDDVLPNLPWMDTKAAKRSKQVKLFLNAAVTLLTTLWCTMIQDRPAPFSVGLDVPTKVPVIPRGPTAAFVPTPAPLQAAPAIPQLSYEEYLQQQEDLERPHQHVDTGSAVPVQDGGALRKRKEREFELQLMSGDLTGLDRSGAVQEISIQHEWNEMAYTEQQRQQQEVQRGFGIGTNKMLSQVSKAANRKHQLSSLAIKAAETELAMLEKRGARNLTKSETQGKYGW